MVRRSMAVGPPNGRDGLRIFDAPGPRVQLPDDAAAGQAVEEFDADAAGDASEVPNGQALDSRTDRRSRHRVEELGRDEADGEADPMIAGVTPEAEASPDQLPSLVEGVI